MTVCTRSILPLPLIAALLLGLLPGCDGSLNAGKPRTSHGDGDGDGDGDSGDGDGDSGDGDGDSGDGDGDSGDGDGDSGDGDGDGDSGDGDSGDGDGDSDGIHGMPTLPDGRGATMPFIEYEAEDMDSNGDVLGPSTEFGQVPAEASNRRAVRLSEVGDYVKFESKERANGIVVRYSIPDSGHDYWTTLNVYVNDELRAHLAVTSRYSWTYGDDSKFNRPEQEDPGQGYAHHFFDEARALIGDVPKGATVMVRKDGDNGASHYDIDLVDLEPVPEPFGQPAGSINLRDCGATPDDDSDDSDAIQGCVNWARDERKVLYIPPGTFHSYSKDISVAQVTIRGAGMWHSVVHGYHAHFDCYGGGCKYQDFAVFGDTVRRLDDENLTAFGGNGSSDSSLENVWIEHAKTGYWPGPDTQNLVIRNTRFRNLFADGVNLYGGTSHSLIENCHARNTGDDAFAAWSHNTHATNRQNAMKHNFVQLPWRANCFALYGGEDTELADNVCADVVQYPGILVARQFDSTEFTGKTQIQRNSLIRAGGYAYGQGQGAFKLHADQGPIHNIEVTDLDIVSPTFFGIHVQGTDTTDSVWFTNVNIYRPGTAAFLLNWGATGAMDVNATTVTDAPTSVVDDSGGHFTILRGQGNMGW